MPPSPLAPDLVTRCRDTIGHVPGRYVGLQLLRTMPSCHLYACAVCDTTTAVPLATPCTECGGQGYVCVQMPGDYGDVRSVRCEDCNGRGVPACEWCRTVAAVLEHGGTPLCLGCVPEAMQDAVSDARHVLGLAGGPLGPLVGGHNGPESRVDMQTTMQPAAAEVPHTPTECVR